MRVQCQVSVVRWRGCLEMMPGLWKLDLRRLLRVVEERGRSCERIPGHERLLYLGI